jgi:sigma-E factor negative regulatory protein RseC
VTPVADERVRLAGIVRELRRTPSGNLAEVLLEAAPACPRCAEGRGCGAGLFGRRRRLARVRVPGDSASEFEIGQAVTLSVAGERLLGIALAAYGLPLAGAVLATGAAGLAGLGEGAAILAAACGLAAGAGLARRRLRSAGGAEVPVLGIES